MRCPYCSTSDDKVIDSRPLEEQSVIRRRRECLHCHRRFTTYERLDSNPLMVVKSDNRREPFNREKLRGGIVKACEKLPVSRETVERIIDQIDYELQEYVLEVPSRVIGERVLQKLHAVDVIAYIRFASVYRQFQDLNTFLTELEKLKKEKDVQTDMAAVLLHKE